LVNRFQKKIEHELPLQLNFMVHFICKYLLVIGVVLLGFQSNAFADDKDKDKKKDKPTVTRTDTVVIKVNIEIQSDDTLVFDDFDEDDNDGKKDNGSIAIVQVIPPVYRCIIPKQDITHKLSVCTVTIVSETDDTQTDILSDILSDINDDAVLESNIYPNPALANSQSIWVTHNLTSNVTISVYTLTGQVIRNLNTDQQKVEMPGLSTGLYIVHIAGAGQSESKRLLVE
jgi:hypothetical protein